MTRGVRLSEKWFRRALWVLAVVFAWFLIGLGGLIVGDLPQVERMLDREQFLDLEQARPLRAQLTALEREVKELGERREEAEQAARSARQAVTGAQEALRDWIATRGATGRADQDPEVIERTRRLDALRAQDRSAQRALEAIDERMTAAGQRRDRQRAALRALEEEADKHLARAQNMQELRVFLYRLAFTLPPLALAGWLFVKKRHGRYWPFVWGFVFFALFVFFVELVPYLPSYGGYVRYLVGIALTVLIGHYAIRAMQRYLERQKAQEAEPESARRQRLPYDLALARLAKKVCPGCERPVDVGDASINHCPHCGIALFDRCAACGVRKSAFGHFCHACGAPAQPSATDSITG